MSDAGQRDDDVLASREAGHKIIRGGVLRTGGYVAGLLLTAVASIFLLRYLGVVDFGKYVTVMSVIAVASGLTDVGLTVIGQREVSTEATAEGRRDLLGRLMGIRLAITPIGVALGVAFVAVAGYGSTMVAGTALAGAGLVLVNTATTMTIPLSVELRFVGLTAIELARQAALVAGFGLLVIAGATLVAFFSMQIVAGLVALALTWLIVGPSGRTRPRFDVGAWMPLLREAAPVAIALVVNVLYVRILVILISLLGNGEQTGLFAASYRIVEIFVAVPALMLGTAFPLLAHAGAADQERLAYAMQRLGEVAFLVAVGLALVLMIGAKPIMAVLGGSQYDGAVPVLQIQAWALVGAFMTQGWVLGLVAIRRQRALIVTNAIALVVVLALGFALIPADAERGAAIAAVIGEAVLAVATFVMLVRARPDLRPSLGYVPRVVLSAAVAVAVGLLLPLPDVVGAALAGVVYIGMAWIVRAVPVEVLQALARREEAA